jgi:hypothetical protein
MNFFKTLFSAVFSDHSVNHSHTDINPANGLPMIDQSGIDIAGNTYGTDHSSMTDSFTDWGSSSSSNWDSSSSDWGSSSGSSFGGSDW